MFRYKYTIFREHNMPCLKPSATDKLFIKEIYKEIIYKRTTVQIWDKWNLEINMQKYTYCFQIFYIVHQSNIFRSLMGSSSGIHIKVRFQKNRVSNIYTVCQKMLD
jgi:hypothetical protein